MLAPGAIECAHSTSSETSSAQALWFSMPVPLLLGGGAFVGGLPWSASVSKVGMPAVQVTPASPHLCCSPNAVSNTFRSLRMVSLPNESTITIVCPRPVTPRAYSGPTLYEFCIAAGAKQRRPTEKHCASVGGVVLALRNCHSDTSG